MVSVDRDRLVETASRLVNVPSFTGDEEAAARLDARRSHIKAVFRSQFS